MSNYELENFLLFSADVYKRLVFTFNNDNIAISIAATGLLAFVTLSTRPATAIKLCFAILAASWAWLGWRFYIIEFASINWFATYMGVLCLLQIPMFIALSIKNIELGYKIEQSLLYITLSYLILVRPIILYLVYGSFTFPGLAVSPIPTVLFAIGILFSIRQQYRWLFLLIPISLMILESITLYLVQDEMWTEGIVITALMMMLATYGRYNICRLKDKTSFLPLVLTQRK